MIISQALTSAAKLFIHSESPSLDARVLLGYALGVDASYLYAHADASLGEQSEALFEILVQRRAKGEPVAYITNRREFYGSSFFVDSRVLIPRPETEVLVDQALALLKGAENPRILDICCGSGCIGISVAINLGKCDLALSDISSEAIQVAKINALRAMPGKRAEFYVGDLFGPLQQEPPFDAILSNPPYIADSEMSGLSCSIRAYEPALALQAGPGGLDLIDKIITQAPDYIKSGGFLAIEAGHSQSEAVASLMAIAFGNCTVAKDLAGIDRVFIGFMR
ncbi:MAG: peptide chain release factor N(5)-glutamine methyltransferase [Eubacteriaceae bacterium]|nr:peptide chain release factor N(5)-glutamine methyltransferase [Eubacteriaceae bacterium]